MLVLYRGRSREPTGNTSISLDSVIDDGTLKLYQIRTRVTIIQCSPVLLPVFDRGTAGRSPCAEVITSVSHTVVVILQDMLIMNITFVDVNIYQPLSETGQ